MFAFCLGAEDSEGPVSSGDCYDIATANSTFCCIDEDGEMDCQNYYEDCDQDFEVLVAGDTHRTFSFNLPGIKTKCEKYFAHDNGQGGCSIGGSLGSDERTFRDIKGNNDC